MLQSVLVRPAEINIKVSEVKSLTSAATYAAHDRPQALRQSLCSIAATSYTQEDSWHSRRRWAFRNEQNSFFGIFTERQWPINRLAGSTAE